MESNIDFMKLYEIRENGLLHQKVRNEDFCYDYEYTANSYTQERDKNDNMSFLRLGGLIGSIGHVPDSLLDVGYGSGSFLKAAAQIVNDANGYDIPPAFPVEDENVTIVDSMYSRYYEVVTFFDSLEHFPDIYEIEKLMTDYIYISCPWCHFEENQDEKSFMSWKHRKPNEHLWFFGVNSLKNFMKEVGFTYISHNNMEDVIRKPVRSEANILTALFKRK